MAKTKKSIKKSKQAESEKRVHALQTEIAATVNNVSKQMEGLNFVEITKAFSLVLYAHSKKILDKNNESK